MRVLEQAKVEVFDRYGHHEDARETFGLMTASCVPDFLR